MMISLRFLVSEKFLRKDGTCPVFIQYNYNSKSRPLLNTQISIPPAYWDNKACCIRKNIPKEFGLADDLNYQLKKAFRIAEDLVIFSKKKEISNPPNFVKDNFNLDFDITTLQNN